MSNDAKVDTKALPNVSRYYSCYYNSIIIIINIIIIIINIINLKITISFRNYEKPINITFQ